MTCCYDPPERGLWSETNSLPCLALWGAQKSERLAGKWGVGSARGVSHGESRGRKPPTRLGNRPDVGRGR